MNKEILKHYYEEGKKFGYALARGATDLPSVQTFDELYTAQLQQHGVMQAEASAGAKGAAVGQRSVGTNAEGRHCGTCKYAESDNPYPCGACSGDYSLWEAPSVGHL